MTVVILNSYRSRVKIFSTVNRKIRKGKKNQRFVRIKRKVRNKRVSIVITFGCLQGVKKLLNKKE
jgi:hypothetical protein